MIEKNSASNKPENLTLGARQRIIDSGKKNLDPSATALFPSKIDRNNSTVAPKVAVKLAPNNAIKVIE